MSDAAPAASSEPAYCDHCGRAVAAADAADQHADCRARREMEPPRYCAHCARRLVVQVVPTGWTARCSRHGESASA